VDPNYSVFLDVSSSSSSSDEGSNNNNEGCGNLITSDKTQAKTGLSTVTLAVVVGVIGAALLTGIVFFYSVL